MHGSIASAYDINGSKEKGIVREHDAFEVQ